MEGVFWSVRRTFDISVCIRLTQLSTEPNTGLETLKLRTLATKNGDHYSVSGQKMSVIPIVAITCLAVADHHTSWISSAQVASKMILLARTTPLEEVKKPSEGLSLFFIDFDKSAAGLELKRIKKMGGRAIDANEVFFDDYRVPADTLIGQEGQGFKIVCVSHERDIIHSIAHSKPGAAWNERRTMSVGRRSAGPWLCGS
jgi:alkylation response protein AidB-like acyl-CoA dehydrogenase